MTMRNACKKMRRCANDSCNIQLQKDSCLPAKTNDKVATRPAQLVNSRTAPSLLLASHPPTSAALARVSRLSLKVIVSGHFCRAPFLSFPSPLSRQLLQGTTSPTRGQRRTWGVTAALGPRAAQGSLPALSCHQIVSPSQTSRQQPSFLPR